MQTVAIPMEELVPVLRLQMEQGGTAPLTVTGSSMLPMLRDRKDRVYLQCPVKAPENRTVALYRRDNGMYVLHRLIKALAGGRYLCCGDNQWQTEVIHADQVIGVVTAFDRKGRHYPVGHRGYRFYAWLWSALLPVRRPILALRRLLGRLRRAAQKNTQKRRG